MVTASGSELMDLPGVGPIVAARTLADVGDVAHPDPQRHRRPRLSPAQNRRRQDADGGHALPQTPICDAVYRQLVADTHAAGRGPAGQGGATQDSCAVDLPLPIDTPDQPLLGRVPTTLPPTTTDANPGPGSGPGRTRRRAGVVKVQRPTDERP